MKNKLCLVSVLVFLGLVAWGAEKVWAITTALPRVTTACETKIGGLLLGIGDGFSSLKSCPGGSRKVTLGEESQNSDTSGQIGAGDILFITELNKTILKKDGTAWWYDDMGKSWRQDTYKTLPTGFDIKTIVQWSGNMFLTQNGGYLYVD
jgi:hypothetical protein